MKRETVFVTADGTRFATAKEAKAHESSITLDGLLTGWADKDGRVALTSLREEMVTASWTLINLLTAIARQTPLGDDDEAPAVEDKKEAA